jgi:outer membrane protein assembly factor BamD
MAPKFLQAFALIGALGACSCTLAPTVPLTAAQFQANAEGAYEQALQAFFQKDWTNAITLMEDVRKQYAGTKFARLAQLRIADAHYHQAEYTEAVTIYRAFVRDYPSDPELRYARYREILCLFDSRGESLFSAPLEERDLVNIQDANRAIAEFQRDFPDYEPARMTYMYQWVRGMLARHELYVARYYLDRANFAAALSRAQYAVSNYQDTGLEPEALVLLGETHMREGHRPEAQAAFDLVLVRYPKSPFAEPARRFLAELGRSQVGAAKASP